MQTEIRTVKDYEHYLEVVGKASEALESLKESLEQCKYIRKRTDAEGHDEVWQHRTKHEEGNCQHYAFYLADAARELFNDTRWW